MPITVLRESEADKRRTGEEVIIGLEFTVLGEVVRFQIAAAQAEAKLADIVPPAREVSRKVTDVVAAKVRQAGGRIPCRPGCGACCRSLVPLSVPEMLRLVQEIQAMPKSRRRTVQRSFLMSARQILKDSRPKLFSGPTIPESPDNPVEPEAVSRWYASLKLDCPFLCKGRCTIYEQRPLACREHFVKGSARACRGEPGVAEVVPIPVRASNALVYLARELEGRDAEAVMMPLSFVWYQSNAERGEQTWPATMMVARFVEIVKEMTLDASVAGVA